MKKETKFGKIAAWYCKLMQIDPKDLQESDIFTIFMIMEYEQNIHR